MAQWAAEVVVDEALARDLVARQFPPLPERSLRMLSEGWDYVVALVDDSWVFRFPRREVVVAGTQRELAVLPRLELPVDVPRPSHVGRPSEAFPWPFYGAPYISGDEPTGLDSGVRARLARPLAAALRTLHASSFPELPVDPVRRADMTVRVPRTRGALTAIADLWEPPPIVEEVLVAAEALPPPEPTAVVHGDLHFRQLLVHHGELAGIIDWIDVCRSDPGPDLQLVWSFLPPPARSEFLDEYGPRPPGALLRARVLALFLNAILARYGRDHGNAAVEAEAVAGLNRTVDTSWPPAM